MRSQLPGTDPEALIGFPEVMERVEAQLRLGMGRLTHVPGCSAMHGRWANFCVGFLQWWVKARLEKHVGKPGALHGGKTGDPAAEMAEILNEFENRFASLVAEYEAECGLLQTEPAQERAMRLAQESVLPEWWPEGSDLGTGLTILLNNASVEAAELVLRPEFQFVEKAGNGGVVFKSSCTWRTELGQQGIPLDMHNDLRIRILEAFCEGREDWFTCEAVEVEAAGVFFSVVTVSEALLGHMLLQERHYAAQRMEVRQAGLDGGLSRSSSHQGSPLSRSSSAAERILEDRARRAGSG